VQEAVNHNIFLNKLAISTLFEKNKNVEFISLFSLQNTHYKIDYTTLFKEIKNIKKQLR